MTGTFLITTDDNDELPTPNEWPRYLVQDRREYAQQVENSKDETPIQKAKTMSKKDETTTSRKPKTMIKKDETTTSRKPKKMIKKDETTTSRKRKKVASGWLSGKVSGKVGIHWLG